MTDDRKTKNPWSIIIIGIVIYVLFMLWVNQRNENEQTKQEFALETGQALNQQAVFATETQQIEAKIKGSISVNDVSLYIGTDQCVVDYIFDVEELPPDDYYGNSIYLAFFNSLPNTFRLIGEDLIFLNGKCVRACGIIYVDSYGIPTMNIIKGQYGINIEKLPDDVCRR